MMKVNTAPGFDWQLKRLLRKYYSVQSYRKAIKALVIKIKKYCSSSRIMH